MVSGVSEHVERNRDLWDKRVRGHLLEGLYPSAAVEAGSYEVGFPDRVEVGDVAKRRVLHLQCNAGADTLYWARQGVSVVGIDFSAEAIRKANRLAEVAGIDAQFVCADIFDLSDLNLGGFDIVYTSMGVLWWLPDLGRWAELIADHLDPSGFFYIHEIHPASMIFGENDHGDLVATFDYFSTGEPIVFQTTGTYYDAPGFSAEAGTECGWIHTLADVITALAEARLRIEFLHEHPTTGFRMLPSFQPDDEGRWAPPEVRPNLPLTFSLKASRP